MPADKGIQPYQNYHSDVEKEPDGLSTILAREIEVDEKEWSSYWASRKNLLAYPYNIKDSSRYIQWRSPYHPVACAWFAVMLLIDLAYTAFWVPLSVAFCTDNFGDSMYSCTWVDLAGGIIYAINLAANFWFGAVLKFNYKRTTVMEWQTVAKLYIKTLRFWLDLLAVVPFVYLLVLFSVPSVDHDPKNGSWISILSLFRLVRLLRLISLSKVVVSNTLSGRFQELLSKYLNVTTLYVILLAYLLAVIINLEACVMLMIATLEGYENSWLTSVSWEDFTAVPPVYRWYAAVYWVITTSTTTGYGDFVPRSTVEQVFANLYMIGGMVMFGLLVGTVANALTRASLSAAQLHRFRKKMSAVNTWLINNKVPGPAAQQVKDYFSDVWLMRNESSLDAEIFSDLPTALRQHVAQYITTDVVAEMPLFVTQDEGLQSLIAAALRPVDVVPGHDLCRQGEEGDRLWICEEGKIQAVQHQGQPCFPATPCLLGEGVILGDDMPAFRLRPFTYRALGRVKMWELRLSDLYPILRMYPSLKRHLVEYFRDRLLHELGVQPHGSTPGRLPGMISDHVNSSWCESVRCIAPVLKQSPEVEQAGIAELQSAQIDDGSLPTLLDGLLDFCTMTPQRVTLLEGLSSLGPDGQSGVLPQHKFMKQEDDTRVTTQQKQDAQQQQPLLQTVLSGGAGLSAKLSVRRALTSTSSSDIGALFPSQQQHHLQAQRNALTGVALPSGHHGLQPQSSHQRHQHSANTACTACGRAVCAACKFTLPPVQAQSREHEEAPQQILSDVEIKRAVSSSQLTAASPFVAGTDEASEQFHTGQPKAGNTSSSTLIAGSVQDVSHPAADHVVESNINNINMDSARVITHHSRADTGMPRGSVLLASLQRSAVRNAAAAASEGGIPSVQQVSPTSVSNPPHPHLHQRRLLTDMSSSRVERMGSRRHNGVTSSMSMHPSLANMSIPTANFGEGYSQWG